MAKDHYFDIVNLDQYHLILGTLFMRKHKATISFDETAYLQIYSECHYEHQGKFGAPSKNGGDTVKIKSVKTVPMVQIDMLAAIADNTAIK
jgi:hypothetical protein